MSEEEKDEATTEMSEHPWYKLRADNERLRICVTQAEAECARLRGKLHEANTTDLENNSALIKQRDEARAECERLRGEVEKGEALSLDWMKSCHARGAFIEKAEGLAASLKLEVDQLRTQLQARAVPAFSYALYDGPRFASGKDHYVTKANGVRFGPPYEDLGCVKAFIETLNEWCTTNWPKPQPQAAVPGKTSGDSPVNKEDDHARDNGCGCARSPLETIARTDVASEVEGPGQDYEVKRRPETASLTAGDGSNGVPDSPNVPIVVTSDGPERGDTLRGVTQDGLLDALEKKDKYIRQLKGTIKGQQGSIDKMQKELFVLRHGMWVNRFVEAVAHVNAARKDALEAAHRECSDPNIRPGETVNGYSRHYAQRIEKLIREVEAGKSRAEG